VGTIVNTVFFYYYVYNAERPKLENGASVDDHMRHFAIEVLIGISVSNVFANWIMYGLSWAPIGPAQWAYPVVTGTIVFGGAVLFLYIKQDKQCPTCRRTSRSTSKTIGVAEVAQHGIVPAVSAFAYVFGVGEALSGSGVRLSVVVSVVPYVFVIVIPAYGLMHVHNTRKAAHLSQPPNGASLTAVRTLRL
jgi:uncharacterized membrane protein